MLDIKTISADKMWFGTELIFCYLFISLPPTISNSVFQIPDAHLEGVSIYSGADPEPVREVLKPGPGVNNTDVILYIVSKTTKLCVARVSKKYICF